MYIVNQIIFIIVRFGVIFNTKRAKQGVSCFPIYRLPPRYNGSAVIIADDPLPCAGQLSVVLRRRCALPFLRQSGLFLACPSLPDFVCHHRTACGIRHPDAEFWQRQRPLLFFRQRWLVLQMIARHRRPLSHCHYPRTMGILRRARRLENRCSAAYRWYANKQIFKQRSHTQNPQVRT